MIAQPDDVALSASSLLSDRAQSNNPNFAMNPRRMAAHDSLGAAVRAAAPYGMIDVDDEYELINVANSVLIIIDMQEKLLPAMHDPASTEQNCQLLATVATELDVPIVATEQYPIGLGSTINALTTFEQCETFEKIHFSAFHTAEFDAYLDELDCAQLIIAGIESHVCVLQTALHGLRQNYNVCVVVDAIDSRAPIDKQMAVERMRQHGVDMVTTEMVIFEWLERAGTDAFRRIAPLLAKRSVQ